MESQLQRPVHGQVEQGDPLSTGAQSGETKKKSMLKKVKEKAKKIKGSLKKKGGNGDEPEREYRHDDDPEVEEDEEDEASADPEVRGAPMYGSTVISSRNVPGQDGPNPDSGVKNVNISRPDDPVKTEPAADNQLPVLPENGMIGIKDELQRGAISEDPRAKIGQPFNMEEDPHAPKNSPQEIPPSNYESKVPDPFGEGGRVADVAPLAQRLDDQNVTDESVTPESEQRSLSGSHGQLTPEPLTKKTQFTEESNIDNNDSKSFGTGESKGIPRDTATGNVTSAITDKAVAAKDLVTSKLGYGGGGDQDSSTKLDDSTRFTEDTNDSKSFRSGESEGMPRDTVTGKVSSAVTDKAVAAKDAVASKLGYGGEGHDPSNKPESEPAQGYVQKIVDTLNPIYEKVAGAGSAAVSKVQGGGAQGIQPEEGGRQGYLSDKLKPADEDKALSEVITNALHPKKNGMQKTGEQTDAGAHLSVGAENKRE